MGAGCSLTSDAYPPPESHHDSRGSAYRATASKGGGGGPSSIGAKEPPISYGTALHVQIHGGIGGDRPPGHGRLSRQSSLSRSIRGAPVKLDPLRVVSSSSTSTITSSSTASGGQMSSTQLLQAEDTPSGGAHTPRSSTRASVLNSGQATPQSQQQQRQQLPLYAKPLPMTNNNQHLPKLGGSATLISPTGVRITKLARHPSVTSAQGTSVADAGDIDVASTPLSVPSGQHVQVTPPVESESTRSKRGSRIESSRQSTSAFATPSLTSPSTTVSTASMQVTPLMPSHGGRISPHSGLRPSHAQQQYQMQQQNQHQQQQQLLPVLSHKSLTPHHRVASMPSLHHPPTLPLPVGGVKAIVHGTFGASPAGPPTTAHAPTGGQGVAPPTHPHPSAHTPQASDYLSPEFPHHSSSSGHGAAGGLHPPIISRSISPSTSQQQHLPGFSPLPPQSVGPSVSTGGVVTIGPPPNAIAMSTALVYNEANPEYVDYKKQWGEENAREVLRRKAQKENPTFSRSLLTTPDRSTCTSPYLHGAASPHGHFSPIHGFIQPGSPMNGSTTNARAISPMGYRSARGVVSPLLMSALSPGSSPRLPQLTPDEALSPFDVVAGGPIDEPVTIGVPGITTEGTIIGSGYLVGERTALALLVEDKIPSGVVSPIPGFRVMSLSPVPFELGLQPFATGTSGTHPHPSSPPHNPLAPPPGRTRLRVSSGALSPTGTPAVLSPRRNSTSFVANSRNGTTSGGPAASSPATRVVSPVGGGSSLGFLSVEEQLRMRQEKTPSGQGFYSTEEQMRAQQLVQAQQQIQTALALAQQVQQLQLQQQHQGVLSRPHSDLVALPPPIGHVGVGVLSAPPADSTRLPLSTPQLQHYPHSGETSSSDNASFEAQRLVSLARQQQQLQLNQVQPRTAQAS